jgi:hypothetical protein
MQFKSPSCSKERKRPRIFSGAAQFQFLVLCLGTRRRHRPGSLLIWSPLAGGCFALRGVVRCRRRRRSKVLLRHIDWWLLPRNLRWRLSRRWHRFRSDLGFRLLVRSIRRRFSGRWHRFRGDFGFGRRLFDRRDARLTRRRHHVWSFLSAFVLLDPLIVYRRVSDGRAVR